MFNVHLKKVSRVCLGLFGFIFFVVEDFVIDPDLELKNNKKLKCKKRFKKIILQIIDFFKKIYFM